MTIRDVLSRYTVPTPESERVIEAHKKGLRASKRPGMLATDCPYDEPKLVLAWRYGWNGHRLPLPEMLH